MLLLVSACATTQGEWGTEQVLRAQNALGVQRILILGVSFPDIKPERSLEQIREHVLEKAARYYAKASYGKTTLVGDIKGWYVLPHPLDKYKIAPENINVDRRRVWRLVEDAFNAAERDVVLTQYSHIVIVVGVRTGPGVGYGMIAYSANPGMLTLGGMRYGRARMERIETRGGQHFNGGIIVVAQNAHVGHIVHDLAHALGGVVKGRRPIPDLYDTVLQGKVGPLSREAYAKFTIFMGPWDVMSRHFIKRGEPPPGISSFTRLRMGWIEDDQVVEVTPGESRAVTLQPLGGGKGILVIRIPGRWGTYYLLENRQKLPGDPILPSTGLLVLHVDESREDGDGIVRVLDANSKVPDFGDAAVGVSLGQTPSVRLPRDVAIEVLWQQGMDLTLMITKRFNAPEIQAAARRIREIDGRLEALPKSSAYVQAKAELTNAMELLLQMQVSDVKSKLDNFKWP
ncbi:MAG: hypothetical protein KKD92_15235 [Proteobacteria bacterium]|nr:hypothetical protein [Pseudomonadota bacterium]